MAKSAHAATNFAQKGMIFLRIAICDDNELQIEIFKTRMDGFLRRNGDSGCTITAYTTGKPLIDDVNDGVWYDIIVLDIILKDENGIDVARHLRKNGYVGNITFWTAHKEYVFDALDILPVHYIIKGSENGRMYTAFNHALEHISKSTLMIKGKDFIHRVEFQNIEYIESRNKYIIIHCTCGIVYTERCKLSDIEELLDSRFLRCHQSYIINMDEVKEINTSFIMFSGNTVPIRRKDYAKIRNEFEEYTTFK